MQTITIEIENPKHAEIILLLAETLQCKITAVKAEKKKIDRPELAKLFKSLADNGSLAEIIPDPVAWQKEIRRDRPLPGRE